MAQIPLFLLETDEIIVGRENGAEIDKRNYEQDHKNQLHGQAEESQRQVPGKKSMPRLDFFHVFDLAQLWQSEPLEVDCCPFEDVELAR